MTRTYCNVYTKTAWSESWAYQKYIEAVSASQVMAPSVATAKLLLRYGYGSWEDGVSMISTDAATSARNIYIQIRTTTFADGSNETVRFTGWVPTEQFKLKGDDGVAKASDHLFVAQDLSTLLLNRCDGGWVRPCGSGGTYTPILIDAMPAFNSRASSGGTLVGNRSSVKVSVDGGTTPPTYVFSDEGDSWSNYDIIEYLLRHCQAIDGVPFDLDISTAIKTALQATFSIYNFKGKTVRDALNMLLPRSRGFCWYVYDDDGTFRIYIQTILDTDMTIAGVTIPANDSQITTNLWTDPSQVSVDVSQDSSLFYDRIIARGQKMKTCFTVKFEDDHLDKSWSDTEETNYKDAALNSTGYSSLTDDQKIKANDRYRSTDKFDRVYSHFIIPKSYVWLSGTDNICPFMNDAGDLDVFTQSQYWNHNKRLMPSVPLKSGFDYTSSTPVDNNPDDTDPDFLPLMVFAKNHEDKYSLVDKLEPQGVSVRPLPTEMGFELKGRPRHITAANHFTGAEPAKLDNYDEWGFDYETLIATVCLESDQYVQIVENVTTGAENARTLIIDVPEAELWYLPPYTTVGIDADGALQDCGATPDLLRDDRDSLKNVLASAMAFYGRRRNKLAMTIKAIDAPANIGQLIQDVQVINDNQPSVAGTIVTSINFDFKKLTTTMKTDFWEINFSKPASSAGTTSIPTLRAAAHAIAQQQTDIDTLKNESTKTIVRNADNPGVASGGGLEYAWFQIQAADADPYVDYINAKQWDMSTGAIVSGASATKIALPHEIRKTPWDGKTVTIVGDSIGYTYLTTVSRTANNTTQEVVETQKINKPYSAGDLLWCVKIGVGGVTGTGVTGADWQDMNQTYRYWGVE